MIIDFHTHTFPPGLAPRAIKLLIDNAAPTVTMKNRTDGTAEGLIDSMKRCGIDISVTLGVATKPSQVSTINKGCAETEYPGIAQFGTIHPEMDGFEAEIDYLTDKGVRGIKLHPEYQYCYLDNPKYYPIYEKLSASGLLVTVHSGKDPGPFTNDHALPPAILKVHNDFPKLRIIAAHLGGWMVWDEVSEVLAGIDIFFDTSAVYRFLPSEQFVKLCRKHGTEKIVFGSDSPWYDQGECANWIKNCGLNDNEVEAILEKNARNLLGL
jgi:predicted TIM-barrel fold metal-dependent hydrolase